MKKILFDLLFKLLEIVLVLLLGYIIYGLCNIIFPYIFAIMSTFLIGYFFGDVIRPYINNIRIWIYNKIIIKK